MGLTFRIPYHQGRSQPFPSAGASSWQFFHFLPNFPFFFPFFLIFPVFVVDFCGWKYIKPNPIWLVPNVWNDSFYYAPTPAWVYQSIIGIQTTRSCYPWYCNWLPTLCHKYVLVLITKLAQSSMWCAHYLYYTGQMRWYADQLGLIQTLPIFLEHPRVLLILGMKLVGVCNYFSH